MDQENRKLLDEVIKKRLETALKTDADKDERNIAFKQAMDAIDRQTELAKLDASHEEQLKKQEIAQSEISIESAKLDIEKAKLNASHEEQLKKQELAWSEISIESAKLDIEKAKLNASHEEQVKKQELAENEAKKDWIIRSLEISAAIVITPIMQYYTNKGFAKLMCNFEKDYTFTTSAGRSLSRVFRFNK